MAVLRTYSDVLAFDGGPTEAEQKLIEACKTGEPCDLEDGTLPETATPARVIRAEVLRYLLLGGCKDCQLDSRGVRLAGAYIEGSLDISFAKTQGATQLQNCHFTALLDSTQTHFELVILSGSHLKGWRAQGAKCDGSVFLREVTASDTIQVNNTRFGGQFNCDGARFDVENSLAINAQGAAFDGSVSLRHIAATGTIRLDGATVTRQLNLSGARIKTTGRFAIVATKAQILGGVFLHPRTQGEKDAITSAFHCTGEIRLNGAKLGGIYAQQTTCIATSTGQSLSLGGATVNGAVRLDGCNSTGELLLAGCRISGRLTCERITLKNDTGHAFNGQAMQVDHSFVWKKVDHTSGAVSLNGAHVAELDDHPDNWPDSDNLFLDGFTYDRIKGKVSTSSERMEWLQNGSYFGDEFRPQPYSQYAKFLWDTGHDEDARRVLYEREQLRRASTRAQRRAAQGRFALPLNLWFGFWDILLRLVVGYGHYPFRSVAALATLICCTIVPAHYAWEEGSFAPNAAPVLVSQDWTTLARTEEQPAAVWSGDALPTGSDLTASDWKATAPGRDWETFNRYAYGFDVVIPIIDFGQTEAWAPSTNRGPVGWHLWWARWVFSVMGWIVTALGAAAITGIIRRD